MKEPYALVNILFAFLIICIAVIISLQGKWTALEGVAEKHKNIQVVKHGGYYNSRAITSADGSTDIPIDRIDRNPYSTAMIGDTKGISSTSATMITP